MPLKSTQTNKYETACFVQEAGVGANMDRGTLKILKNNYPENRDYAKDTCYLPFTYIVS